MSNKNKCLICDSRMRCDEHLNVTNTVFGVPCMPPKKEDDTMTEREKLKIIIAEKIRNHRNLRFKDRPKGWELAREVLQEAIKIVESV